MALAMGGCQSPWSSAGDTSHWDASAATSADATPADGTTSTASDVTGRSADIRLGSVSTSGDDQAMATVLDDLQQVGQIDPVAQQKLLEKLRETEPAMRPLVAQQFRAALAYHEQLMAESPASSTRAAAWPNANQSDPIGKLVDPRALRRDSVYEQVLSQATPAAIPVPGLDEPGVPPGVPPLASPDVPPAFAGDTSAASPIPSQPGTTVPTTSDGEPAIETPRAPVRVSYETTGNKLPGVEPAVLRTPATGTALDGTSPHPGPPSKELDVDWQQLVEEAAADLSRKVPDSPQSTAEVHQHVSLRILELLAGHTEEALRPIPHISPTEQQYWSAQLFALATYLDHHTQPDDKCRAAASAVQLDEALAHLRELGALSLRNLTFCTRVYDFGVYDPCDGTTFSPGQQISLYAEVENYRSESTEKGYTTSLGTSYEIIDDDDQRVDSGQFPDVEDCCRSRRRDFHIQYGLALPKDIGPGNYRLALVVKDRLSDKIGHGSIPLKIGDSRR